MLGLRKSSATDWISEELYGQRTVQVLTPKINELDYPNAGTLRAASADILRRADHRLIVVDLSKTTYLDASALGVLLSFSKEALSMDSRMVIVTNEVVENILSLTRLMKLFKIASTKEEAVAILVDSEPAPP